MTDAPARSRYFILYDMVLDDGLVARAKARLEDEDEPTEEFTEAVEDEIHSQSSDYDAIPPFESLDRETWINDETYHAAYHLLKHSDLRDEAGNALGKMKVQMALLYALDELTS